MKDTLTAENEVQAALIASFPQDFLSSSRDLKWWPSNISPSYSSNATSKYCYWCHWLISSFSHGCWWCLTGLFQEMVFGWGKKKKSDCSTRKVMWNKITYVTMVQHILPEPRVFNCVCTWVLAHANQLSISGAKPCRVTADLFHIISNFYQISASVHREILPMWLYVTPASRSFSACMNIIRCTI